MYLFHVPALYKCIQRSLCGFMIFPIIYIVDILDVLLLSLLCLFVVLYLFCRYKYFYSCCICVYFCNWNALCAALSVQLQCKLAGCNARHTHTHSDTSKHAFCISVCLHFMIIAARQICYLRTN